MNQNENLEDQEQKPKPRGKTYLNSRQLKTLRSYVEALRNGENKSFAKCATESGYLAPHAAVRTMLNNTTINAYLQKKMEEKHVGVDSIVTDLAELRKATLPGKDGHPDNFIRMKNVEFRAKLLDAIPSQKVEVDKRQITININVDTLEKLRQLKGEQELKKLME